MGVRVVIMGVRVVIGVVCCCWEGRKGERWVWGDVVAGVVVIVIMRC